ncbi:MAG: helix-turn-helix domain-containing protein [Elusimicrobiota bacterium]
MTQQQDSEARDAGSVLRKRRTLRGHSLEAAHQHTRIPKRLLEALEENDARAFPAPVYMRGFLKNYCDYLELEFEPVWRLLAPPPPADETAAETPRSKTTAIDDIPRLPFAPQTAVFAASALLVAGLALWSLLGGRGAQQDDAAAQRQAAPERAAATLELTASKDLHIRLKIDGAPRFEGRIPSGERQRWEAHKNVALRTVDPDALRLIFGGSEISLSDIPIDSAGWRTINR